MGVVVIKSTDLLSESMSSQELIYLVVLLFPGLLLSILVMVTFAAGG